MESREKADELKQSTEYTKTQPQQPIIYVNNVQPEEKNNRGKSFLKAISSLVGFLTLIILGLLILNALTGIGDELHKQSDIMGKQTDILQSIERGIQELLKQIRQLTS